MKHYQKEKPTHFASYRSIRSCGLSRENNGDAGSSPTILANFPDCKFLPAKSKMFYNLKIFSKLNNWDFKLTNSSYMRTETEPNETDVIKIS